MINVRFCDEIKIALYEPNENIQESRQRHTVGSCGQARNQFQQNAKQTQFDFVDVVVFALIKFYGEPHAVEHIA